MSRLGVTREQVFDAAETLAAAGSNPTITRIRAELGGGSPNTITPLLREWREARPVVPKSAAPDIPDPVAASFRAAWSAACSEANQRLDGERAALDQARHDMDIERQELSSEIDRLDTTLEQSESAKATLEKQSHEQTLRAELAISQLAKAEAHGSQQALQITKMLEELAQANAQVKNIKALIIAAEDRAKAAETREREARDKAAKLEGKLEALSLK